MKRIKAMLLLVLSAACYTAGAQKPINWQTSQLMEPATLAQTMQQTPAMAPLVISIGPGALIPNSVDIGPANETERLEALKKLLAGKKKKEEVVVYCGCCPFDRCPNVRPAIQALKEAGFTNYYLLNLKTDLKTDWIDKGYPTTK